MTDGSNITPFPTANADEATKEAWQREGVVRNFLQVSRQSTPLAPQQMDIVHRVIAIHEIEVKRVLDLGAGDGFAAALILERHPIERIVLVDSSKTSLNEAKVLFEGTPFPVEYVEGDLAGDDWFDEAQRGGPYDLVISRYAIHHIPDDRKRALYQKAFDFLRPGGLFVNIDHVASASPKLEEAFSRLMVEGILRQQATPETKIEIETSFNNRESDVVNMLAPLETQLAWLRDAGFGDVDVVFKLFELATFTGRRPEN